MVDKVGVQAEEQQITVRPGGAHGPHLKVLGVVGVVVVPPEHLVRRHVDVQVAVLLGRIAAARGVCQGETNAVVADVLERPGAVSPAQQVCSGQGCRLAGVDPAVYGGDGILRFGEGQGPAVGGEVCAVPVHILDIPVRIPGGEALYLPTSRLRALPEW